MAELLLLEVSLGLKYVNGTTCKDWIDVCLGDGFELMISRSTATVHSNANVYLLQ